MANLKQFRHSSRNFPLSTLEGQLQALASLPQKRLENSDLTVEELIAIGCLLDDFKAATSIRAPPSKDMLYEAVDCLRSVGTKKLSWR